MSKRYPMIEYMKRGPHDEINTPPSAVDPLSAYLPFDKIVWECAPGEGHLVQILQDLGMDVEAEQDRDFFKWEPDSWDCIITNPPYSKKKEFLARCNELGKPWALLLPVTTLGARGCQLELDDVEIVFLPKRIDFTGGGAPWFAVAWFTKGLNLGKQVNFAQ